MAVQEHRGAFGADTFGVIAERIARFFGTPQYIVGQSIVVIAWLILNAFAFAGRWDPYPFILLNLAFSLQAAYAAPLILLAQTRQADRDKRLESGPSTTTRSRSLRGAAGGRDQGGDGQADRAPRVEHEADA